MRLNGILRICIILACCSACASGPAPERSPKHIRLSLRHFSKGAVSYTKGCFPKALSHFMEAHERYSAADHLPGVAASLNSMANTYYRLDDLESALLVYDEAIELYHLLGDRTGLVRATTNMGAVLIADGRLDEAETVLDRADALAEKTGILQLLRLKNRAIFLMARKDVAGAKKILEQALNISRESQGGQTAAVQYTMGRLLLSDNSPFQAIAHFNLALENDRDSGAYFGIGEDLAALGACFEELAQYDQAVIYFKRSLKVFALLGNTRKIEDLSHSLERSAARSGADIRATLHWVDQWQAGRREANLCR